MAETRASAAGRVRSSLPGTQALSVGEAGAKRPPAELGLGSLGGALRWLQGWGWEGDC